MTGKPLVSVSCITYNQKPFIRQCLDGILMQQTDFPFEVLIHDDASTDGTQDIIEEYRLRFPDIIKPYYQTENQYHKSERFVGLDINNDRAQGKYIAFCEGDDYWIDPHKLQMQVDFLEGHPDYSLCYSGFNMIDGEGRPIASGTYGWPIEESFSGVALPKLFNYNFVLTVTVCMRKAAYDSMSKEVGNIDHSIYFAAAFCGKFHCIDRPLATYRIHHGGVTLSDGKGIYALCMNAYYYWADLLFEQAPLYLSKYDAFLCKKRIFFQCYADHSISMISSRKARFMYWSLYFPLRRIRDGVRTIIKRGH